MNLLNRLPPSVKEIICGQKNPDYQVQHVMQLDAMKSSSSVMICPAVLQLMCTDTYSCRPRFTF